MDENDILNQVLFSLLDYYYIYDNLGLSCKKIDLIMDIAETLEYQSLRQSTLYA